MRIEPAGAVRTFGSRLAQENGWSRAYADRVEAEYRRFLYLMATADRDVTPSDAVDQAWHLHLGYTRHYWEELCGRIVGRPLHHGPSAGGPEEANRYRAQYRDTLELYRNMFGRIPPADIWPDPDTRFAGRWRRVDLGRVTLVPRSAARILLGLGLTLPLAACASAIGASAVIPAAFVGIGVALLVTGLSARRTQRPSRDGCGGEVMIGSEGSDCHGDDGDGGGDGGGCGGCGGD